jgi:hypothetical protein
VAFIIPKNIQLIIRKHNGLVASSQVSSRTISRLVGSFRRRDTIGSILIVSLAMTIVPSIVIVIRENRVGISEQRLESQSRLLDSGQIDGTTNTGSSLFKNLASAIGDERSNPLYPARARVADALFVARQAQLLRLPSERKAGLDHALDALRIAQAEAKRPHWGEAKTVAGFVHALRDGEDAAVTRQTVAESYADAPYLRYAAAWRVQYGLRHWEKFEPVTRRQIVNEAVWLSRLDSRSHEQIFAMARDSAAYKPFVLRALAARSDDADFQ